MAMNRKVSGTATSVPAGLAIGAGISMGITILLAMIAATMADREILAEQSIGYAAMIILLAASIAGAAIAVGKIKRQKLLVCLASGGIYYLMLLSITALFFGGQYTGMGVTGLVILGGCGTVVLAGMGQGGRQGRKRKKKITR